MKKILLLFTVLIFSNRLISQERLNIPTKFPTDYGVFTFPLGSKITLELREKGSKYEYRVLNIEPYEKYYSLDKREKLFSENPKEKTIELFFMGAYYKEGKEGKDWKTVLNLRSNLDVSLSYKADIKYYYKNEFENTSISGAFPHASMIEIWQRKIDYITLYDFEKK